MHSQPSVAIKQAWQNLWQAHPKVWLSLEFLQERIGYHFVEPMFLYEALTHRSVLMELGGQKQATTELPWNERLEFLGDSVLGLAISRRLMQASEVHAEGELSRMRAALVNETSLAQVARQIDLGASLLLGRGAEQSGGRQRDSLLADAFEALLGAVFSDGGFAAADTVVGSLFQDVFSSQLQLLAQSDFKTLLQEYTQEHHKAVPDYGVVREMGPAHDKQFEVVVSLAGQELGRGMGSSKKRASQIAARQALECLHSQNERTKKRKSVMKIMRDTEL